MRWMNAGRSTGQGEHREQHGTQRCLQLWNGTVKDRCLGGMTSKRWSERRKMHLLQTHRVKGSLGR